MGNHLRAEFSARILRQDFQTRFSNKILSQNLPPRSRGPRYHVARHTTQQPRTRRKTGRHPGGAGLGSGPDRRSNSGPAGGRSPPGDRSLAGPEAEVQGPAGGSKYRAKALSPVERTAFSESPSVRENRKCHEGRNLNGKNTTHKSRQKKCVSKV